MAKPIAVVYVPKDLGSGKRTSWVDCQMIIEYFKNTMPDYYWLAFPDYTLETIKLEVFHEKDFTEIQYSELLELVSQKLKSIEESKKEQL